MWARVGSHTSGWHTDNQPRRASTRPGPVRVEPAGLPIRGQMDETGGVEGGREVIPYHKHVRVPPSLPYSAAFFLVESLQRRRQPRSSSVIVISGGRTRLRGCDPNSRGHQGPAVSPDIHVGRVMRDF
jgi:hypothetical protein